MVVGSWDVVCQRTWCIACGVLKEMSHGNM